VTPLEAHAHFAARTDRSVHPEDIQADLGRGPVSVWPAALAAMASLSGMLSECETDDDLDEAVRHYRAIFDPDSHADLAAETGAVIADVIHFGWAVEAGEGSTD
jgi:hypothetical protein